MQTRTANLKDINKISSILTKSWKSAYRGIINDSYLNSLPDNHWVNFLTSGLNDDNIFAMVIEVSKQIAGAAILSIDKTKNTANLISFYLLPEFIGHGFGHTFYNSIERELIHRGISKCILEVLTQNKRAIRFYEARGFTDTGKTVIAALDNCDYICNVYEKEFII